MKIPSIIKNALTVAKSFGVHSIAANALEQPKTVKSAKELNVLTLPIHLAPDTEAGLKTVCAYAGACRDVCLDGSGNPAYETGKRKARINRTRFFWGNKPEFMLVMFYEIVRHVAHANKLAMTPAVRPNATSDNMYERIPLTVTFAMQNWAWHAYGVTVRTGESANIMQAFPDVQFYDYTKIPLRYRLPYLPENYSLTYSYDPKNKLSDLQEAITDGFNIAVPFQGKTLPDSYQFAGMAVLPVINGDSHDYRPNDPRGVIVGLKFKRITSKHVIARIGSQRAKTGDGFAVQVQA